MSLSQIKKELNWATQLDSNQNQIAAQKVSEMPKTGLFNANHSNGFSM